MADQSPLGEGRFRPELAESERRPDPAPPNKPRGPWVTVAALGMLALSKLKFLLIGLKALPFAKILLTSGTMLVSMAVYAIGMGAGTQALLGIPVTVLFGTPGVTVRTTFMFAGWAINLAVAEYVIRRRAQRPTRTSAGLGRPGTAHALAR